MAIQSKARKNSATHTLLTQYIQGFCSAIPDNKTQLTESGVTEKQDTINHRLREMSTITVYVANPHDYLNEVWLSKLYKLLDHSEKNNLNRFKKSELVAEKVISRGLLKVCIGRFIGCEARKVKITGAEFIKPKVNKSFQKNQIEFNLTHTEGLIAIGISNDIPIGVDSEYLDEKKIDHSTAESYCTAQELLRINKCRSKDQAKHLMYSYWVKKESLLKCIGIGLAADPKLIELANSTHDTDVNLNFDTELDIKREDYSMQMLDVGQNHMLCISIKNEQIPVKIQMIKLKPALIDAYLSRCSTHLC